MTRAAALALGLALAGCTVGERWTASRKDYALYRDARLAASTEARLAKSYVYLREEPDGRFRREIERWFAQAEPRFYAAARDRPSLLRAYLRAMPEGPNAGNARDRLTELEILRQYRRREEDRDAERLRRVEETLARADRERRAFVADVAELVREVASVRSFGASLSALDDGLKVRLFRDRSAYACDAARCVTKLSRRYAIPENREITARVAELEIALTLERGVLARASFGGPLLFSRFAEAVDLQPVAVTDLGARVEAIGRSAQMLANALEPVLPAAECARAAIAPRILVRECRGVRVEAVAGVALGDFDRVEVSPASPGRAP